VVASERYGASEKGAMTAARQHAVGREKRTRTAAVKRGGLRSGANIQFIRLYIYIYM